MKLLHTVRLEDKSDVMPRISGGQKQRVAIARCLSMKGQKEKVLTKM